MSQCPECAKTLASPAGLRRHINSQHQRKEWHACECGKQFLDPAGRSRCRARHTKSFACPVCTYQSSRKDSVKQHMRRRHQSSRLTIVTVQMPVPVDRHRLRDSSDSSIEFDVSPPPDLEQSVPQMIPVAPMFDMNTRSAYQPTIYFQQPSPAESWQMYG